MHCRVHTGYEVRGRYIFVTGMSLLGADVIRLRDFNEDLLAD